MGNTPSDFPEPQPKLAADAALELMKQLITLSSGVLALSATFIEKLAPLGLWRIPLAVAWLCLIAALVAALQVISAIVKSMLLPEHDWSTGYGQRAASLSKYAFVVGIALVALVAFGSLIRARAPDTIPAATTVYTVSQSQQLTCPVRHGRAGAVNVGP
jgi:hypothetical protein